MEEHVTLEQAVQEAHRFFEDLGDPPCSDEEIIEWLISNAKRTDEDIKTFPFDFWFLKMKQWAWDLKAQGLLD